MNPKVADFGISKLVPHVGATHVTALGDVQGTFGYIDPEFMMSSKWTSKSDVYAFGVVMLELVSAKAVVVPTRGEGVEANLARWATPLIEAGRLEEVVDPALSNIFQTEEGKDSVDRVARLTIRCSTVDSKFRPNMHEVWHTAQSVALKV